MKSCCVAIQTKGTEQYFPVVLFLMLYKVVLTFESEGGIVKCDHLNENYRDVLSSCLKYMAEPGFDLNSKPSAPVLVTAFPRPVFSLIKLGGRKETPSENFIKNVAPGINYDFNAFL